MRSAPCAGEANVQAVWRWNAQQIGALSESDFYLDPHTKHYTGMKPILKGWCPVIRWADKALHSDFVQGQMRSLAEQASEMGQIVSRAAMDAARSKS